MATESTVGAETSTGADPTTSAGTSTTTNSTSSGSKPSGSSTSGSSSSTTTLGDVGSGATVSYVGKISDVTDYSVQTGLDLGKYGYYFPQFGQATPKSKRVAKDNMRFSKPSWQRDWEWKVFEQCGGQFCNLFSPDAGVFDLLEGEEGIGVYSKSEGAAWAKIKYTGGEGNSGTVVDESANDNSGLPRNLWVNGRPERPDLRWCRRLAQANRWTCSGSGRLPIA
ncbi:MAG TPA: hypothetical protein ENJ18_05320 [Nannocystis exedens]|nr:hypothetical protein [Nannocystis exedens]